MHRTFSKLMNEKSKLAYFDNEKVDVEDTSLMVSGSGFDEKGKKNGKANSKGEKTISVIHSFLP